MASNPKSQIKMRVNKEKHPICEVCKNGRNASLELFDIAFSKDCLITVCDACMETLFTKSLKATNSVNQKTKTSVDINIINNRGRQQRNYPCRLNEITE